MSQGECATSIAASHGLKTATLWDCADNAEIRRNREPHVLQPGDVLFVPDPRPGTMSIGTGRRHTFRATNQRERLELRLLDGDTPRAGETYTLQVGELRTEGETDQDGWIRESLPRGATEARLRLGDGDEAYRLRLGYLDPVDTVSGQQARLANLGFFDPPIDGKSSRALHAAILAFQYAEALSETGEMDELTAARLRAVHGS